MSFFLDMTSVMKMFQTEIKVISNVIDGQAVEGKWVRGRWVEQTAESKEEVQTFYEPFVPNTRQDMYSLVDALRDTGHVTKFNAVWISSQKFPMQTLVEHNSHRYRVVDIQDLTDYSNVTLYYLESEEKSDGNK